MTATITRPSWKAVSALYAWNTLKLALGAADTIAFWWMIGSGFSSWPTTAFGLLLVAELVAFIVYPLLFGTPRWYRNLRITDNRLRRLAGKPTGGFD